MNVITTKSSKKISTTKTLSESKNNWYCFFIAHFATRQAVSSITYKYLNASVDVWIFFPDFGIRWDDESLEQNGTDCFCTVVPAMGVAMTGCGFGYNYAEL